MIASAVLNLLSGLYLRAGKYRTFSIVVASLNCLHMPLGTVLRIFTIMVLLRDSVRQRYQWSNSSMLSLYPLAMD